MCAVHLVGHINAPSAAPVSILACIVLQGQKSVVYIGKLDYILLFYLYKWLAYIQLAIAIASTIRVWNSSQTKLIRWDQEYLVNNG